MLRSIAIGAAVAVVLLVTWGGSFLVSPTSALLAALP